MSANPLDQLSPYDLRHLVAHLAVAGRAQEVHRLLALETAEQGNAWFSAREAAGEMQDYLTDIQRARQLAQPNPGDGASFSRSLGLQCRYLLITASINSLADNLPIELLLRLVESGLWMPEQGLALVRQIPYPAQRVRALVALAPHFPAKEQKQILNQALVISKGITDEEGQAGALKGLAERLAALGRFKEALSTARLIRDDFELGLSLAGIAPYLPETMLREILADIQQMEDETVRAQALAGLLPRLAALGHPREALVAVEQIKDELDRRGSLVELGSYLPEANLRQALSIARGITDQIQREVALANLLPYLAEAGHVQEAFSALQHFEHEWEHDEALARMAPHLPENLVRKALSKKYWEGEDPSAEALAGLLPRLAELGHLEEALATAWEINSPFPYHTKVLIAMAPYLQEEQLQEVLSSVNRLAYSAERTDALVALAPHLPEALQRAALSNTQEVEYEQDKASALAGFVPYLEVTFLQEALEIARQIGDEENRAQALAKLLPRLAALGQSEAGLTAARQIGDARHRAQALMGIFSCLPESDREHVFRDALSAARQIENEFYRAETLADLAALLPVTDRLPLLHEALSGLRQLDDEGPQQRALARMLPRLADLGALQEAWSAALEIAYDLQRADALKGIAPFLPETLLNQALDNARRMQNKVLQERAQSGLLPRVAELGNSRKALNSARMIGDNYLRAIALAGIVPHLIEPEYGHVLGEALAAVRQIRKGDPYWVGVLLRLAPHLPETIVREMVAEVLQIEDAAARTETLTGLVSQLPRSEQLPTLRQAVAAARQVTYRRADSLTKLAPLLTIFPSEELNNIWMDFLRALSTGTRSDALSDLTALEPISSSLGGGESLLELTRAVQDVGKWWP